MPDAAVAGAALSEDPQAVAKNATAASARAAPPIRLVITPDMQRREPRRTVGWTSKFGESAFPGNFEVRSS
ncbi:hypothetical protein GCM10009827_077970 [Dactylosporangium maewongense]|uniref:Uncharacterized protein n=1 Tax=Dactylosporangium maewongense TaxID=634393 RepID=A0ABN2BT81_9ACTN